jgi:hypothetical protein
LGNEYLKGIKTKKILHIHYGVHSIKDFIFILCKAYKVKISLNAYNIQTIISRSYRLFCDPPKYTKFVYYIGTIGIPIARP